MTNAEESLLDAQMTATISTKTSQKAVVTARSRRRTGALGRDLAKGRRPSFHGRRHQGWVWRYRARSDS